LYNFATITEKPCFCETGFQKIFNNFSISTNICIIFAVDDLGVMATMVLKESQQATMKKQLEDLLVSISWRDLANRYFGKSGSWLYHKLDGVDGNKKPTEFTLEEKYQLKGALVDLADRIRRAADSIE
jgi:hypothetical protein